MTASRRSILGLLGVASAMAVNTEAMADPGLNDMALKGVPNLHTRGMHAQLAIADALEALARGIREGRCAAPTLKVESHFLPDNWIEHEIHVKVELLNETATS